jgi:hypothetical protein
VGNGWTVNKWFSASPAGLEWSLEPFNPSKRTMQIHLRLDSIKGRNMPTNGYLYQSEEKHYYLCGNQTTDLHMYNIMHSCMHKGLHYARPPTRRDHQINFTFDSLFFCLILSRLDITWLWRWWINWIRNTNLSQSGAILILRNMIMLQLQYENVFMKVTLWNSA